MIIKYTQPTTIFNIFYLAKTFLTVKTKRTNKDKFDSFVTTKRWCPPICVWLDNTADLLICKLIRQPQFMGTATINPCIPKLAYPWFKTLIHSCANVFKIKSTLILHFNPYVCIHMYISNWHKERVGFAPAPKYQIPMAWK